MTWWNRPSMQDKEGLICDGSVRSGKTVCMVDGFFLWSMHRFNGCCFAICGRSIGALRRNIITHLQAWLGDLFLIQELRGEHKLVVSAPNGHCNVYYLFGGQDESSYKHIQGITLAGVLLDEVALMPRSFVEQTCARCSVEGSKLWFNCNPAGPEHWFYKEWLCKARQKKLLHLHFTMQDNPGLSPAIRQRYENLYAGLFYRRYVLGQWCAAEGLVYAFDPEKHLAKQLPQFGRYYISVDYGTMNPFSAGLWCVVGGKAYRLREFYHNGRLCGNQMTDEQYYMALEALAGTLPVEQVIIDPSAASLIALIRQKGRFSVRKARNDVLPGIRLVSSLLEQGALLFSENCKDTLREFALYRWQEDSAQDRPVKQDDHAMDDIRYFCATVLRKTERMKLY